MKLPCEVAVKSVVPAVRALLAKELIETYGMKQTEAANLLGITQTAVSKYIHNVRGNLLQIEKEKAVRVQIKETAASLVSGNKDRMALILDLCDTCRLARKKRLMCELCQRASPILNLAHCRLCDFSSSSDPRKRR
ncbi:MAG: transcriptional regulator [Candidatus Bathyarchaeota archaeon]|nr:MAG: transcriptional regulator [Candidatus Bathyarchaeota archaeon]